MNQLIIKFNFLNLKWGVLLSY